MRDKPPDLEPVAWSPRHTVAFVLTLTVLALLPWTVRHWPSQDGQNHLAVAYVLMHYGDAGSSFPRYVDVETGFRPSTAIYGILTFLGRGLSLQTAEKILVSLAIVLLPTSLWLLVKRALPRRLINVLLALPFVVGWAFAMGFLSFLLAMGFGVVSLALAWDVPRDDGTTRPLGLRHLAAAMTFFLCVWFHPVSAVITGLCLLLLEGRSLRTLTAWARILAVAGPGALFLVASYAAAHPAPQSAAVPTETSWADPLTVVGGLFEYHLAYTPLELVPRLVALVLLVRFAYVGVRRYSPFGATAEGGIARVVLSFTALYCLTPHALHGWYYSSTRFLSFASLLLPALAEFPSRVGRRLVVLAPALTLAVLSVQWPNIRSTSQAMQDILDVGEAIPRASKIVPMDFTARLLGPQPLDHAWAELVVERDAMAPQLFAAGKPRMGGEQFRTLTFHPGLLDEASGRLPWSTYETWYDVVRKCGSNKMLAWLQFGASGECAALLAARKATLDEVLDRYDDVLMLNPPDYAKELIATRVELVEHKGSAWLFRVLAGHLGQVSPASGSH